MLREEDRGVLAAGRLRRCQNRLGVIPDVYQRRAVGGRRPGLGHHHCDRVAHEADHAAFPCNALSDKNVCPLEVEPAVDVVVDHRAHPHPRPTRSEDGVTCEYGPGEYARCKFLDEAIPVRELFEE